MRKGPEEEARPHAGEPHCKLRQLRTRMPKLPGRVRVVVVVVRMTSMSFIHFDIGIAPITDELTCHFGK